MLCVLHEMFVLECDIIDWEWKKLSETFLFKHMLTATNYILQTFLAQLQTKLYLLKCGGKSQETNSYFLVS